ncbi:MAG: Lrp/AsnC family transcriptional regulator [Clostridium sp.]|nr:Lrp/AsnC family transcriptional regulator [Prevotella sp.]MCM1428553.1 Lrp/AsnC family transcriptional regulator [Clostridium sp.]MCM1475017.1 Lrp/AsnC family transcriptional regulator [Muribaculaceae bacterium]
MENLDKIDIKLLQCLQNNSRLTTKDLAKEVNLSTTPVYERVKRLENEGYIRRYVAILDPEKLNLGFTVYVYVKLSKQTHQGAKDFIEAIKDLPEVTECYSLAGKFDYMMKLHAPNMRYYRNLVLDVLGSIESVGSVESTFVMHEVKRTTNLPLNQLHYQRINALPKKDE